MDMEDESVAGTKDFCVAGTKIWTVSFSNHSSDGLPFFSVLIA